MQWSLVLLSILGLTAASPLQGSDIKEILLKGDITPRNAALENVLRGLLEDLRQTMLTGTNVIPVLDPLEVPLLDINESLVEGLTLSLSNLKVKNLSTFKEEQLTVQLSIPLQLRLTFDFHIPVLEVEADEYDLQLFVSGFTLFGKGKAKINIIKPAISGYAVATPSIGDNAIYLTLQEVVIKLSIAEFDSQITGLLGGDENLNGFVNIFLKFFVPDVIELYEDEITETVSAVALLWGNVILSQLNLIDLIP